ncbi:carbohydrate-binding domain-containing protein [Micromonospora sp. NPDC023966]|uniref:carbohydrate-binding domain-containing protein n=1 Tax=Micromonospora sp. NPDC023966 TaxID=3154699 RepID=UPI00340E71D6
MTNASRTTFLGSALTALVLSIAPPAFAADGQVPDAVPAPVSRATAPDSVSIVPSAEGIHILDISSNTITLASGGTFIYTVDTPEGQGRTTLEVKSVDQLLKEITAKDGSTQTYTVEDSQGAQKRPTDRVVPGDVLTVTAGHKTHHYTIDIVKGAVRGRLELQQKEITANATSDVVVNFTAGMRSPASDVRVKVPRGIRATMDNTTVNVIGRGEVKLSGLATQSVGRVGAGYRFQRVGTATIEGLQDGGQIITFHGLDLRPSNGVDLQIRFTHVSVKQGSYSFEASYTTSEPEELTSPAAAAILQVVKTVSDLHRVLDKSLTYRETPDTYTKARFRWTTPQHAASVRLLQSTDRGATWTQSKATVDSRTGEVEVEDLTPDTEYNFKLDVRGGRTNGESNVASFYTGKLNAKLMGAKGDGLADDTEAINRAIRYLHEIGGGTLLFENGTFNVRTVHLLSNVYLYVGKDATISAIKGADAPEALYFSDKAYRSGTSPTDPGPYEDPENYTTKQDVGHTYFRNSMFFGERVDNVKIIGNGRITGNGNIVTTDKVMDNAPDLRADKMVTLKLSTNVEFGGLNNGLDLWYEETDSPTTDQPYYIKSLAKDGITESKQTDISNMLKVDNAGHFALLATGTDQINTHDFYYDKGKGGQARDVFDFMQSSYVTVKNIYAKGTSDDIVKPGSDSSLGFTRPATDFYVRNVIGDTNCNLFQIGSETADDIRNAYVDNIYVLAGNKAGFSISTNDGATVENIYLNSGKTGPVHHQAQMRRTRAPFFISISNRGRVIGGQAQRTKFMENGVQRDELLSTNVNIGHVRNVHIKDVNIEEVYGGSQYSDPSKRWVPYTNQNKATPIIAGYKVGEGGPTLPDGRTIGYVENVTFENVNLLVKGGNSYEDSQISPPELGVGKYNVADFGVQPSYGFWARHVQGLSFKNVTTNFESNDDRYAFVLDDVKNAELDGLTIVRGTNNPSVIQLKNASNITLRDSAFYDGTWGEELTPLQDLTNVTVPDAQAYPPIVKDPHNIAIQLKRSGHENVTGLDTQSRVVTTVLGSTVADLTTQIESTDGTAQTYTVADPDGRPKSADASLDTGDTLVVTAEDGTTRVEYRIVVTPDLVIEGESQLGFVVRSVPSITLSTSSTNGRTYLQTSSVPAGEWIQFLVDVPVAGTYDVLYQYKTNTSGRATVQAYVDGAARGAAVDQNSSTANQYVPVNLGRLTFADAGQHPVRFEAVKSGSIVIDYIKLTRVVGGQARSAAHSKA